ncbi:MAG TPA: DoxX family membrane protein [Xanthomonadales bacterium]|nr:DoxX family membrane protein [Xanthomonadales bacterium]
MKTTATVARILLGLVFFAAGLGGFLLISHPPAQPPGLAGEFQDVFFRSYWVLFVDGVELIAGLLLLSNRYVPLGLTLLAAVIANIIVFHATMAPLGLPVAAIVAVLWTIVATRYRSSFAPLFVQNPDLGPDRVDHSGPQTTTAALARA